MPELTFIFGPNNTFFFDSPKSWKFHGIPGTLRQLFNASMNPGWRVQQPYCLALAPQDKAPEPVWYIGCKVVDGNDKIFFSQTHFDINYPDLAQWTRTIPNAPQACFVTFGPGLSYFACAPGFGSIWAGIPTDLRDKVQKAFDTPSQVSLGMNNSWFVLWPDGYYAWKFYGEYGELDKILNSAEPRSVAHLAISPYSKDQYFVAFKNRTVKYSLSPEWMPQMQEVFYEWQAEILQAQQTPQQQYLQPGSMYPTQSLDVKLPLTPQSPNTPAYVYPHYAQAPAQSQYGYGQPPMPLSPQSPYLQPYQPSPLLGSGPMPSPQLAAPPQEHQEKKKRKFFSRLSSSHSKTAVNAATTITDAGPAVNTVTSSGSQTCTVM